MHIETREWENEQPDGGIVYFVAAEVYDDDGTYLGRHSRHWHLDVRAPTTGQVQATKESARQWAMDHAEEMRQRRQGREARRQQKQQRRAEARAALRNLRD